MTKQFRCVRCGSLVTAYETQKTVNCPVCGQVYSNVGDPPFDWASFFWGVVAGLIFSGFVFTALGRQIIEAMGYKVLEKVV